MRPPLPATATIGWHDDVYEATLLTHTIPIRKRIPYKMAMATT